MNDTALLLSGRLGSWPYSLPTLLANLAVPSRADVFLVTSWRNTLRKRTALGVELREESIVPSSHIMEIQALLGPFLKGILFIEDMPLADQLEVAHDRRLMAQAIAAYQAENVVKRLPPPCEGNNVPPEDAGIGYVVEQYHRARLCFELMQRYEAHQRGCPYAYVMRARPDFILDWKWDLRKWVDEDPGSVYVCGSVRGNVALDEMEWADDFCWFSGRAVAEQLFPKLRRMGLITNRAHNTYNPTQKRDYVFAPETQFSLLLYELDLPVRGLKIYRLRHYTPGGDGFEYMNYKFGELVL